MLRLQSAIVVLVPEAEQLVRPFREKHDPSARAGMPSHITLLYPFKPPREISEVVFDTLNQCFTRFEAFDFSLTTIRRFSPEVLYLAPKPRRVISTAYLGGLGLLSRNAPLRREIFEH
jgi:2'-5' RNA ligase